MDSLYDALYNWLTIKVVVDERPDDTAAQETEKTFFDVLANQHFVSKIEITKDEGTYYVQYEHKGELKKNRFPRDLIEIMLNQINDHPERFRNYE